jgi:hypothetical protein
MNHLEDVSVVAIPSHMDITTLLERFFKSVVKSIFEACVVSIR